MTLSSSRVAVDSGLGEAFATRLGDDDKRGPVTITTTRTPKYAFTTTQRIIT